MNLDILPQYLNSYSLWLQNHQYQSNTIRNYLQDLRSYLVFSNNQISQELIIKYFQQVTLKNNSGRYLASLSIFCQFLLNQHLTDINLFKHAKKHLLRKPTFDLDKLLIQYQNSLVKDHKSNLTVKNYLNDIHQYFVWLDSNEIRN
jgi:site-specific recombinase XerD